MLFMPAWVSLFVPFAATPLNARFIAALYVSLGLGVLLSAFAEQFRAVRLVMIGVGLATALLFVMTLPRLPQINPFPTFWMLFYLIDPVLVLLTFWKLGWRDSPGTEEPARAAVAQPVHPFGIAGVVLLILPQTAIALWPWTMSEELSQMYSMFFLSISAITLLAAREPRWPAVRFVALMVGALALLVLAASRCLWTVQARSDNRRLVCVFRAGSADFWRARHSPGSARSRARNGHMNRQGTRVALDRLTAARLLQIYLWGAMTLLFVQGSGSLILRLRPDIEAATPGCSRR